VGGGAEEFGGIDGAAGSGDGERDGAGFGHGMIISDGLGIL
jgi:hypothetical protein